MIEIPMRESTSNIATFEDIEFEHLKALVKFMYTFKLYAPNVEFAAKVLMAANKYNMPTLKAACEEYIVPRLVDVNIMDSQRLAMDYKLKKLYRATLEYLFTKTADEIDALLLK